MEQQQCPLSAEEHLEKVYVSLILTGTLTGCEGVYKALLEMAEFIRKAKGFEPYTPTGEAVQAMLDAARDRAMLEALEGSDTAKAN